MITLLLILLCLGLVLAVIITGCAVLLDPIICILCIYVIYKLISKLKSKRKK